MDRYILAQVPIYGMSWKQPSLTDSEQVELTLTQPLPLPSWFTSSSENVKHTVHDGKMVLQSLVFHTLGQLAH
jgi:hypothetical protein